MCGIFPYVDPLESPASLTWGKVQELSALRHLASTSDLWTRTGDWTVSQAVLEVIQRGGSAKQLKRSVLVPEETSPSDDPSGNKSDAIGPVTVDVTHTYLSGLVTGIQRVVVNVVRHWLKSKRELELIVFDDRIMSFRALPKTEFLSSVGRTDACAIQARYEKLDGLPVNSKPISHFVLLELPDSGYRLTAIQQLLSAGRLQKFAVLVHDLVPLSLPATCGTGMSEFYAHYLKLVARADVKWTNSMSTREQLLKYGELFSWNSRSVQAFPLPKQGFQGFPEDTVSPRRNGVSRRPSPKCEDATLLMVGSIEPRKNYLKCLFAVERLWKQGLSCDLIVAYSRTWDSPVVLEALAQLRRRGRPIRIEFNPSDDELVALYQESEILLFPSLGEGFGLPVAEALQFGCSVVTSDRGATKEFQAFEKFSSSNSVLVDVTETADIASGILKVVSALCRVEADEQKEVDLTGPGHFADTWDMYARDLWNSLFMRRSDDDDWEGMNG